MFAATIGIGILAEWYLFSGDVRRHVRAVQPGGQEGCSAAYSIAAIEAVISCSMCAFLNSLTYFGFRRNWQPIVGR